MSDPQKFPQTPGASLISVQLCNGVTRAGEYIHYFFHMRSQRTSALCGVPLHDLPVSNIVVKYSGMMCCFGNRKASAIVVL